MKGLIEKEDLGACPSGTALAALRASAPSGLRGVPSHGALRVWWIPQVPMKAFEVDVPDLAAANLLLSALADYDAFQFENNVKPDYCNMGGLMTFDEAAGWFDWECPETGDDFDMVRRDPERLASAIETRSAETAGLGPQDESAVPKGGAHE